MTIFLSLVFRIPLVASIASAYRGRRFARNRLVCRTCQACFEDDSAEMMRQKHYRAAVLMARIELEMHVRELHGGGSNLRPSLLAHRMAGKGLISKNLSNRINASWGRASRIVHGRVCTKGRAASVVRQVQNIIAEVK